VVAEIRSRLGFLADVGLGYLTLDRAAPPVAAAKPSASGWRHNSAATCRACATCWTSRPSACTRATTPSCSRRWPGWARSGNTLVVVEHDEDTIRRADTCHRHRPGAGRRGGQLVAQGSVAALAAAPESVTGRMLAHPMRHPLQPRRPVDEATPRLRLSGASLHNLQRLEVAVPLGRLVAVTGVSGSGKSTLARDVLLANVLARVALQGTAAGRQALAGGRAPALVGCDGLHGTELVERVLEVDQTPIGKTPRSCPATYIGFWDAIRACSPTRWRRARAAMRPRASPSTPAVPAVAAARPAKARA
jgi:excinuclease ABC subunit A